MFSADFEAAKAGKRRDRRTPVALNVEIRHLGRALCKVVDISVHGARLITYSGLNVGTTIRLRLPLIGEVEAVVKWADDFNAGCQFTKPLPADALQYLLEQTAGTPDDPSGR